MSAAVTLVVVAVVVVVLVDGANGFASRSANERARLGVDLLVTVGANVPDLTRSRSSAGCLRPRALSWTPRSFAVSAKAFCPI